MWGIIRIHLQPSYFPSFALIAIFTSSQLFAWTTTKILAGLTKEWPTIFSWKGRMEKWARMFLWLQSRHMGLQFSYFCLVINVFNAQLPYINTISIISSPSTLLHKKQKVGGDEKWHFTAKHWKCSLFLISRLPAVVCKEDIGSRGGLGAAWTAGLQELDLGSATQFMQAKVFQPVIIIVFYLFKRERQEILWQNSLLTSFFNLMISSRWVEPQCPSQLCKLALHTHTETYMNHTDLLIYKICFIVWMQCHINYTYIIYNDYSKM